MNAKNSKKKSSSFIKMNKGEKINELKKESQKTAIKFNYKIKELENQLNKIKSLKISFDKINSMNLKEEEKLMKIKQINESINEISVLKKEILENKIQVIDTLNKFSKPKDPLEIEYGDELFIMREKKEPLKIEYGDELFIKREEKEPLKIEYTEELFIKREEKIYINVIQKCLELSILGELKNKDNDKNNIHNNPKKIDKCVNFISSDQNINFALPCSGGSTFAEIEELLYQEYPEYRGVNKKFMMDGNEVLPFKTINDNKIGTGKPIMLVISS